MAGHSLLASVCQPCDRGDADVCGCAQAERGCLRAGERRISRGCWLLTFRFLGSNPSKPARKPQTPPMTPSVLIGWAWCTCRLSARREGGGSALWRRQASRLTMLQRKLITTASQLGNPRYWRTFGGRGTGGLSCFFSEASACPKRAPGERPTYVYYDVSTESRWRNTALAPTQRCGAQERAGAQNVGAGVCGRRPVCARAWCVRVCVMCLMC